MDSIIRLIHVLEQHKPSPNFLLNLEDSLSQESKLYHLVKNGVVTSDQDAVQQLYGTQESNLPTSYRMLKSRVKKKLFNQLHLLNLQESSSHERTRMRLECRSALYRAQQLYTLDEYYLTIELLEKVLPLMKEYDFFSMELESLLILEGIYFFQKSEKKYRYYAAEVKRVEAIVAIEREATCIYRNIRIHASSFIATRQEVTSSFEDGIRKLKELWERSNTYLTFEYYYTLQVQQYELQGDFENIIKFTAYAEELMISGVLSERFFDKSLNAFISVYAHLRAEYFDKGLELASKALTLFDANSHNWFAFMENYVILALFKRDYNLAKTLMEQVNSNKFYSNLTAPAKDRWLITDTFVNLVLNRTIPLHVLDRLKDAAYISKDKQGFYVYVNVLEFMYLLLTHQDEDTFEMYMDRYRKYASKYLKSDEQERIKIFYKLMALALRECFMYDTCSSKGAALFEKLKATKAPGEAYAEVEIVPFEHLWEMALDIMKSKSRQKV